MFLPQYDSGFEMAVSTILLKKTWHRAIMVAWVRELCGLQVLGRVNCVSYPTLISMVWGSLHGTLTRRLVFGGTCIPLVV